MCDLVDGQAIVARPLGSDPTASIAFAALENVRSRYGASATQHIQSLLSQTPTSAWSGRGGAPRAIHSPPTLPFLVELYTVPNGDELSFVDELRTEYLATVIAHPQMVPQLAANPNLRLAASPNWKSYPAAGVSDPVADPFTVGANHSTYLQQVGLDNATPNEASGIIVAVLDNGFDQAFWQSAPNPVPVAAGQDLISGDQGSSGHGTLVAALVAESAPGVDVVPVRMAGDDSSEWDTLHALTRAVQLGAHIVTLSYSQILGIDNPCSVCGLVRKTARSEVFARMVEWAPDGGRRAILAAAGNNGVGQIAKPAAHAAATPIVALDTSGAALASFSNWDAANTIQALALPGEDVATATTGASYGGTSFATAYAAGLYAVAMQRWNDHDASSVTSTLIANASSTVSNAVVPLLT